MTIIDHMTSAMDLQASLQDKINRQDKYALNIWGNASGIPLTPFDGWWANDFTNSGVPYYGQNTQVKADGLYGATCADLGSGSVGFFLNGYETANIPGQPFWSMSFGGPTRNRIRNWAGTRDFHYTYQERFGYSYFSDPQCMAYSYLGMFVEDMTTGETMNITVNTWDKRDGVSWAISDMIDIVDVRDLAGNVTDILPFITIGLGASSMIDSYGDPFTYGPRNWGDTYTRTGTITQAKMYALIQAYKTLAARAPQYAARGEHAAAAKLNRIATMSNNPGDYELYFFGLQAELGHYPDFVSLSGGQYGVSYHNVNLCTWEV